ncbi:MAG TPA: hypothetical protein VLA36_00355 [Longimicrobiales bacterium]|nr:hypothetical protein [Longimicrobiales bacterium]
MGARFRIRTKEGEELTPKTVEIFSELVRAGAVRPDDLVYDSLTGEWAPASVHPMVRLLHDPLVVDPTAERLGRMLADPPDDADRESEQAGGGGEPPSGSRAGSASPGDGELSLELVEPDSASPEEEARAFIAKMDEERRSDPDRPALSLEVPLVQGGTEVSSDFVPEPEAPQPEAPGSEAADGPPRGESAPFGYEAGAAAVVPRPVPRRRRPAPFRVSGRALAAIAAGAFVVVMLVVMWPERMVDQLPQAGGGTDEAVSPLRRVPVTEEQTRALALTGFLDGVEALRDEMGVGDVPRMWLEGQYLADPGSYPEVRMYWTRFLAFIEAARGAEATLYRGAYLTAAAEAGLTGPVRSLRLASAQEDFAGSRGRRAVIYQKLEELAFAALALDDLVVELSGRVTYEPIRGPRVSADPIIEAAGTDAEAQARLEAALDRVLGVLQGPTGGPAKDRAGVPGWLAEGLREAMEGA